MEMTARLTGDAVVSTLRNGLTVVNFNVAINDSYRVQDQHEPVRVTTYVRCDYWGNTGIAAYLTKGRLIEMQGCIGVNAYKNRDGEARATLTLHVNAIKLHGSSSIKPESANHLAGAATTEDLPF